MDFKTYLIGDLNKNVGFVSHTLGDFTDADLFVRPCPGANTAGWQLGHLISAESSMLKNIAPALAVTLPEGFTDKYNMEANKSEDPAKFAPFNTKAQLLELFTKVRGGTVAWVSSLTSEQLDGPTPDKYKMWAPTLGALAAGQITHTLMHLGQFQVIRRKLNKPVLF
jgi:DinB superfamily